jgi:hypothetical protein
VPFEDVSDLALDTITHADGVQRVSGSATGLATTGNQLWTRNNLRGDLSEAGDQFGRGGAVTDPVRRCGECGGASTAV